MTDSPIEDVEIADPPLPPGLPPSAYFDKPAVVLDDDEVIVVSCLKNEGVRLPYFLDYYRALGVKHFFIIDNASVDGSGDYLRSQPDVILFETDTSYRGSSAGRLWMQELCDHYGQDRWCLTVDVDELLVFPGIEATDLPTLTRYLDAEGSAGLFCVFLDMYSDRPLSQTIYEPGQPFLEACAYFETESYGLRPGGNPPFLNVFGGPRGRSFQASGGERPGPMMKKVPLIRWRRGFSYIFSTHSHIHVPMSALTGALLHFKFFHFFADLAAYEHARGDRRQIADYAHYAASVTDDVMFMSSQSRRYEGSGQLVELGVICAPEAFRDYLIAEAGSDDPAVETALQARFPPPQADPPLGPGGTMTLRWIRKLWPFVSNRAVAAHFSDGLAVRNWVNRSDFVDMARRMVRLADIDPDGLLLWIGERVLYRHADPNLSLVVYAGDRFGFRSRLTGPGARLRVEQSALAAGIYRLDVDWDAVGAAPDEPIPDLRVYVAAEDRLARLVHDAGGTGDIDACLNERPRDWALAALGEPIAQIARAERAPVTGPDALRAAGFDGRLMEIRDGVALVAVRNRASGGWRYPVALWIDGRFVANAWAPPLANEWGPGSREARILRLPLPLGYFFETGEREVTIDIRPVGTQVSLEGVPLTVSDRADRVFDRDGAMTRAARILRNSPPGTPLIRRVGMVAQDVPVLYPALRGIWRRIRR